MTFALEVGSETVFIAYFENIEFMLTINGFGTTIYGCAKRKELHGAELLAAEQSGYLPYSYQVIKWIVIMFMPIIPLGTFRVIRVKQSFWSSRSSRYSMVPVKWDWWQVIRHYLIAYIGVLLIGIGMVLVAVLIGGL